MSVFDGFRFRNARSPIHDIDPRAKLAYMCIVIVAALIFLEPLPLILLLLVQVPFVLIAGVQREWARSMRGAGTFALVIFLTNLAFSFVYAGYSITVPALERAFAMTMRFLLTVASFSAFLLTTPPDRLGLALRHMRVPYDFCFAFTVAVRFIPVLAEEVRTTMDAQKARGLELEKGSFTKRVKNYIPILIPLIANAFRRSLDLGEAMETRAWGAAEKRVDLYPLRMRLKDYAFVALTITILTIAVYARLYLKIPSLSEI